MPTIVWILIIVILIICLIVFFCRNDGTEESTTIDKGTGYRGYRLDDKGYRDFVYKEVKTDFKPYLQQILSNIDAINLIKEKNSKLLSQASYDAMNDIYNKANEIERRINDYWNSRQFDKDFYYYIGLHYASHLLGSAIKQEQQIIKNSFVECKRIQKQWGNKIEELKNRQQRVTGKHKADIGQEIKSCCDTHKQISTLASQLGGTNTKYHERVTIQFKKTAERRDFIASNFGKKGRDWKDRMHRRAEMRKGKTDRQRSIGQ